MRFLFYDRITEIDKGKAVSGVKTFALSEEFFRGHYSKKAVIPGVIFIEAMAQLLGWLIIYTHDFRLSAIMSLVEGVKIAPMLRPGLTAEIHGQIVSTSKRDSLGKARVLVDGREVASMQRIIFSHFHSVDPDELKRRFVYYSGLTPVA
ncbi:Beta-hydroxyacyl-(acyl-carrier-protein) dehydratase, FabA/FabZ domain protein [Candidatus Magnetobacterium bavaricum]|uniref:Beta-hydroxyacyl-(Acyl-carrier-protein) dehydratase, FabA/FabZ domain protein n=1 Tax=Candidatus Magnetobacterium bavaricum TaxID=29290 RepID=A0A0F3GNU9_9BACT|nr:Beta-hydroxyacyl-(acyl-carrier-protein) dehydratase, FabA/FabZ domain protein [Candidatus Magnetobacterium bavaricum]